LGIKFALVPRGEFWISHIGGRPGTTRVAFEQDFYLGVYEVTQEQWQGVMGNNPSYFSRTGAGKDHVQHISDEELRRFPVESVSWTAIHEFARKLNEQEKNRGWLYRLPNEAEWEYACRGAPSTHEDSSYEFYFARPTHDLSFAQANFDAEVPARKGVAGKPLGRTTQVGSYQANRLGLYDMHGNVWECCENSGASYQVIRGGSWSDFGILCQVAARLEHKATPRNQVGFRLARVPTGK